MTKEQLLDEHAKYAWECDESEHVVAYSKAEKAMDEYAKQQAIAFDEWKADNKWVQSLNNNYFMKEHPLQHKTSDQLYSQFIEQQNK